MDMELQWYGDEVDSAIALGAVEGLNHGAHAVLNRTLERVPRRTNALADSLQVMEATVTSLEAAVYTHNEYAVYQHELFSYRRRVGQPKYLESAALDYQEDFQRHVGRLIRHHAR